MAADNPTQFFSLVVSAEVLFSSESRPWLCNESDSHSKDATRATDVTRVKGSFHKTGVADQNGCHGSAF